MAKLYGKLVGAPVQGLMVSGAGLVSDDYKDGRDAVLWRDVATTAGNVIGDAISLGLFPSTAWIDPTRCRYFNDAFGAGCSMTFGDATYPAALVTRSVAAAGGGPLFDFTKAATFMGQVLWQRLGYPTDPKGMLELLATFTGANPANGNFAWQLSGRRH